MCHSRRLAAAGTAPLQVILLGALVALATVACNTRETSNPDSGYASHNGARQEAADLAISSSSDAGSPANDEVPVVLPLDQHGLWEGEWFDAESDLEDNIYVKLDISADESGFEYRHEYRDVPYGPNSVWSGQLRALFSGPYSAKDETTGHVFSLHLDPSDPHARTIEVSGGRSGESAAPDAHSAWLGPADGRYIFKRTVYRAGFDCADATGPIEIAICGNELLALADFKMNVLYRDILDREPVESGQRVTVDQRRFLAERDSRCVIDGDVDTACVARLYSDRLVSLQQLQDPSLGRSSRFDAAYATALLEKGLDIRGGTTARLAMYPLEMKDEGTVEWHVNEDGLLVEQIYTDTRVVWPCDVEFRYSDMFFVGQDGTVWAAAHVNIHEVFPELEDDCVGRRSPDDLELQAGRNALTVWAEGRDVPLSQFDATDDAGFDEWTLLRLSRWTEGVLPDSVGDWLTRHPILTFTG